MLANDVGQVRVRELVPGIDWSLLYAGEVFGTASGGVESGAVYEDLLDLEVHADLDELLGWEGGGAHVSLYQINNGGRNAADLVATLSDPSNIDARPTFRVYTAYLQQNFGGGGSLRFGQIAADDEFFISSTASALINSTFGWPDITEADLPSGGPAYPLATPGVRLKLDPRDDIQLLAAVFSGDPAGDCPAQRDPQDCNAHGTTFSFTGGALLMGEAQYRPSQPIAGRTGSAYRIGGWYHTGVFADQEFGNGEDGLIIPLVDEPDRPIAREGNWGLYAIVDQVLWQGDTTAITAFWRGGIAPPDRNFISWYVDAGLGVRGLIAGRPDDVLTAGFAQSNVSRDDAVLDRTERRLFGFPGKVRRGSTVLELTYSAALTQYWTLQPDLQYIVYSGDPPDDADSPSQDAGEALLLGLRTIVSF
ncbi:MAG: carbohydrate porin [Methyloceanibacter sp.]|nr:carbohydrate porin [Methyloceanibacter sp.]